jgi:hypothetical protein
MLVVCQYLVVSGFACSDFMKFKNFDHLGAGSELGRKRQGKHLTDQITRVLCLQEQEL